MRVPDHVIAARRRALARLLAERRYLPVREICSHLGVSAATARRDLAALARERIVTRTYGGAFAEFDERFPSFAERELSGAAGKRLIADIAASLARPGETIYFDVGTTVNAIAREIAKRRISPLRAVTCSLPAAETLSDAPDVEVFLIGGRLIPRQSALFGAAARDGLKNWVFDRAFLSAEGFDQDGVWNTSTDLVTLQRMLVGRAAALHLCADSTKAHRRAAALLFKWDEVGDFITDLPAAELANLGYRGVMR